MATSSATSAGSSEPGPDAPEPRPAATVILLRDGADGIQTWLLRRVRAMAFAGGMTVFPGGRVDDADAGAVPWAGPPPAEVARRFGCTVEQARSYVVAAVRETFEEAGVLLTHPPHSVAQEGWLVARRAEIESRQLGFAQLLADSALAVDGSLLHPWSRWITPPGESRRYDTHFFVAALPEGASAITGTTEATHLEWLRPADALAEFAAGTRPLLPPTIRAVLPANLN